MFSRKVSCLLLDEKKISASVVLYYINNDSKLS